MALYWKYWKQTLYKRRTLLTILLSVVFLYVAFRAIEWPGVLDAIKQINAWWLIPIVFLIIFTIFIRAVRWYHILRGIKKVKIHTLFEAIMLSYFTNIVLPINIGELIRAYFVKKKAKVGMLAGLGTIAIDRIAGIFGYLAIGIFLIFAVPLAPEFGELRQGIQRAIIISLIVFLAIISLILFIKKHRVKSVSVIHKIASKFTKKHATTITHYSENFFRGLTLGKTKTDTVMILIYSVFTRILYAFTTLLIAKSLGVHLSLTTFLLIDLVVTFAHALGSHLFGIIGTYEAAITYTLAFYGVPKEIGLGIALISDATWLFPTFLIGLFYFWKEGFTLKRISRFKH